jgi:UDP-glucose 4-epimerase
MISFEGKRILVTGGTGSLGQTLVRRILSANNGRPERLVIFSRDEAKQHYLRLALLDRKVATDEVIYENAKDVVSFRIGDVRDLSAVRLAMDGIDIVFNAAALKQVPSCEYFPFEAVQTNVIGAQNIVTAASEKGCSVERVIGISTDKACKPINVMGMSKALQERIFIEANRENDRVIFNCVRYGNVIASRGSIIPLFMEQIEGGGPVTITLPEMTRFLLSLEKAVDTVFEAVKTNGRGETIVPKVASAKIVDVAEVLMDGKEIPIKFTGIRPGEKVHEIMVSEEECFRTYSRGDYFVIQPVLPELRTATSDEAPLTSEYSSKNDNLKLEELRELLTSSMKEIRQFLGRDQR